MSSKGAVNNALVTAKISQKQKLVCFLSIASVIDYV